MRRLRPFRKNKERLADERGAVAVLVAVLMVALVGAGALAVDIGRIGAEKAQLQNGADASALAIAGNCVKTPSTCTSSADGLAAQYTPANSNNGSTVPASVTFPSSKTVTVQTSTPTSGLSLVLAPIFGMASMQVEASATAEWGYPGAGSGFPLALSDTCFDL
ncbi:Tad domain-containing protein, partial [Sinomonas mesophila]|uniref:Tad domain-containing protein n=1 Tax=Sinomonas mesophila TaxID=1531955 RepID=UPI00158E8AC5